MKTFVVFALVLVAVSAIPLKPNDMELRIKKAADDSSMNLDEFVDAWTNKDKASVRVMTDFIIKIAKSGQDHSVKFTRKFSRMHAFLEKVANRNLNIFMKLLATIIDGNRDNESYYDLETVIQWIEKRQERGVEDANLAKALKAAKESQDHLQTMAGTFVSGIKLIKEHSWTAKDITSYTAQVLREHQQPFLDKYQEAMEALYAFRNKQH